MEAAVRKGRELNFDSEGACARFFKDRLGKSYRSLYLDERMKEGTGGMSTVYVTMPKTGHFFGKTKLSAQDLKVARLTQYMYCVGDGPGSLLDLVKGVHGTTFPSGQAREVFSCPGRLVHLVRRSSHVGSRPVKNSWA